MHRMILRDQRCKETGSSYIVDRKFYHTSEASRPLR